MLKILLIFIEHCFFSALLFDIWVINDVAIDIVIGTFKFNFILLLQQLPNLIVENNWCLVRCDWCECQFLSYGFTICHRSQSIVKKRSRPRWIFGRSQCSKFRSGDTSSSSGTGAGNSNRSPASWLLEPSQYWMLIFVIIWQSDKINSIYGNSDLIGWRLIRTDQEH